MKNLLARAILAAILGGLYSTPSSFAQGTAFMYQGRLSNGGSPVNGSYDLSFSLYPANVAGSLLAGPVTNTAVAVTNGLFTTLIDFGPGIFTGASNWLAIAVRTNATGGFSALSPRQPIIPTPYALYSAIAGTAATAGSVPAADVTGTLGLSQLPAGLLTNGATGVNLSGTFTFTGGGLTNAAAWLETGNSGTTNGNFLGTTDNQPLEIRVAGVRAGLISPSNGLPNIVFGTAQNIISNTTAATSILGGGGNRVGAGSSYSVVGGGSGNVIQFVDDHSVIDGGMNNIIQTGANISAIGGGQGNVIGASAFASFIGGGIGNQVFSGASYSVIGGGNANLIQANAYQSVIGGGNGDTIGSGSVGSFIGSGIDNNIQANDIYTVLVGGNQNVIATGAAFAFLGGGQFNYLQGGGTNSVLVGGGQNTVQAPNAVLGGGLQNVVGGSYATVPGGYSNVANGPYSFAAGDQAQALNPGAFVWADAEGAPFSSLAANSFNVRASGGVRFVTGGAGVTVDGQPLSGGGGGGFWTTGGNVGANPTNGAFLGTIDNLPVEFRVNGSRALRLEPGGPSTLVGNGIPTGAPNVVGGSPLNFVVSGVVGAVIGGGGATNYYGVAYHNSIAADFSTIGGGADNFIETNASQSVIGGGSENYIQSNSSWSVITGGNGNSIQTDAGYSFLGGGYGNSIQDGSLESVLCGGFYNFIQTSSLDSFLGGGSYNYIEHNVYFAVLGGGYNNLIQPNAGSFLGGGSFNIIQLNANQSVLSGGNSNVIGSFSYNSTIAGGNQNAIATNCNGATIAGGQLNGIADNNPNAFVAGGYGNQANGNCAFAAGNLATVANANSFVWSDGSATTTSTANQQFMARASGGVVFYTSNGSGSGVSLAAGGGSWANLSDRNAKNDVSPVTGREVLDQLAALPISRWSYKTEPGVTHLGPMAQDFHAAFGLGEDNRHITTVDEEGVALAAIQGLNQKLHEEIGSVRAENADLKGRLERLERLVAERFGSPK